VRKFLVARSRARCVYAGLGVVLTLVAATNFYFSMVNLFFLYYKLSSIFLLVISLPFTKDTLPLVFQA